jgi:O-acetyl-ADP-ribose deacetylase (regulator of RNase III)
MSTTASTKVTANVGDISDQVVDAVVNAANSGLGGGSGVNGAIRRAGGTKIQEYCENLRATTHPDGLPAGQSVITPGGNLPASWIIHTVGPEYGQHGGKEAELLASCYRTALNLAESHKFNSIAFPAISTGVYGYPAQEAAKLASETIREQLPKIRALKEIRMVFVSGEQLRLFQDAFGMEEGLKYLSVTK